jgi:hypothetical protein
MRRHDGILDRLRRVGARRPRAGCGLHHERRGRPRDVSGPDGRLRQSRVVGRLRDESGMTIMELLVGAGLALFVIGTVFAGVRVQGRAAAFQTGLADAQLTSRGAGELLLQDMRMAGFGMLGVSPDDAEDFPPLEVEQSGGVTTLTLRGAFDNVTTTLAGAATKTQTTLNVNPPAMGAFAVNNLVLVDSGLSSEVFTITGVGSSGGNVQLALSGPLKNDYPLGPFVTQLEVVNYTFGAEGGSNMLRRNGQVVAENVPTFQVQYVDEDGTVSPTPADTVRSVLIDFETGQASTLPGNQTAKSKVVTEANMRNLAFRFSLS